MSVKQAATLTEYIELAGGPEQAVRAAYYEGVASQREAWANWFDSLPKGLKDAIQRKRQGADPADAPGITKRGGLPHTIDPVTAFYGSQAALTFDWQADTTSRNICCGQSCSSITPREAGWLRIRNSRYRSSAANFSKL